MPLTFTSRASPIAALVLEHSIETRNHSSALLELDEEVIGSQLVAAEGNFEVRLAQIDAKSIGNTEIATGFEEMAAVWTIFVQILQENHVRYLHHRRRKQNFAKSGG